MCRICAVQIQPRKLVLDHADYTAPTRQHDLDRTDQESICPDGSRSWRENRLSVRSVEDSKGHTITGWNQTAVSTFFSLQEVTRILVHQSNESAYSLPSSLITHTKKNILSCEFEDFGRNSSLEASQGACVILYFDRAYVLVRVLYDVTSWSTNIYSSIYILPLTHK